MGQGTDIEEKTMKLLIDTSIVIDKLRGGHVWDTFWEHADHEAELFLSAIVVFELFSGKSSRDAETVKKITTLLKYYHIIEISNAIARRAGEIYREASARLQVPDYLIAATALDIGAEVVTLNKKHFMKISGVRVYDFD